MCEALGSTRESFLSLLRHEPRTVYLRGCCKLRRILYQKEGKGVSYGFYRGLQNLGKPGRSQQEVAQDQERDFLWGMGGSSLG